MFGGDLPTITQRIVGTSPMVVDWMVSRVGTDWVMQIETIEEVAIMRSCPKCRFQNVGKLVPAATMGTLTADLGKADCGIDLSPES